MALSLRSRDYSYSTVPSNCRMEKGDDWWMKILVFVEDGATAVYIGSSAIEIGEFNRKYSMIFYILMINPLHSQNLEKHIVYKRTIGIV